MRFPLFDFAPRRVAFVSVALVAVVLIAPGAVDAAENAKRPNFVVMMTDDQRWDAMGCAGHPFIKTPHLDRLAAEGARFKNMFVTNALCAPSRATLLSGLYSHAHGVIDNADRQIPAGVKLVSDHLREAGYEVAFCGKSHIKGALRERQWDYYFGYRGQGDYLKPMIAEGVDGKDRPYEGYMDDVVTDHALKFIEKPREKPFALFLFFKAPHRAWLRPRRLHDLYNDVVVKKPDTYDEDLKDYPGKPKAFTQADNKIGDFIDVRTLESFVKDYCATITAADENVGRVTAALEKSGKLDDTAIFFTGDNGFFLGEWRMFDKRFMHEPSIRVPLLVRYPKAFPAGSTPEAMALNVDLAPTILELAGAAVPSTMHGKSLTAVAGATTPDDWRKDWLYEYYEYPGPHSVKKHRGMRTTRFKYIHYYEEPQEFELYNVEEDPDEKVNLYGQDGYQELTQQLAQRLAELRKATGDVDSPATPKP